MGIENARSGTAAAAASASNSKNTTHFPVETKCSRERMKFLDAICLRKGLVLAFLALACLAASATTTPQIDSADPKRYLDDIKALTTPAMQGRGDGSEGLTRAAHLIETRFKNLGLQPAGTESYFQPFTVTTGARLKSGNHLSFQSGATSERLKVNQDFVPFSFSSSGSASGPVVFAGYGTSADEFSYDDYGGADVKGKIVVVLRYEPATFAEKSGNTGLTRHAQLITKAINARNHGAKAVILVNGKLSDQEQDLLTRFGTVSGPEDAGILLVQVKNAVVDDWLTSAGKSLAQLQDQIDKSGKPDTFAFPDNLHVSLDVNIERTQATVNNVLAYLPGRRTST